MGRTICTTPACRVAGIAHWPRPPQCLPPQPVVPCAPFIWQAYHATENTDLGKPLEVVAAESDSAGPWTVSWPQTAPQLLRFKVRMGWPNALYGKGHCALRRCLHVEHAADGSRCLCVQQE